MARAQPPQLVCVLAETRLSDGSRVVTHDLFAQYVWNRKGVPGAVDAANGLGRYHTVLYRGGKRIGPMRQSRTWQQALVYHHIHLLSLRLGTDVLRGVWLSKLNLDGDWLYEFIKAQVPWIR